MRTRLDQFRWLALAVMLVAAWFNYRPMIEYTTFMFNTPIEDMSHGWVVPFVSAFVLWRQRKALREAAGSPDWRGVAWVALFLALAWLGGRGAQSRLEQVTLIGLIWAVPFALWGKGVERLMRFPAAYLTFTIPVSSFVDFFTIHLRIISSALATGILNGVGLSVQRSGTALFSRVPGAEFNVDVADPCSGIRSLFAMMALTAAYAYLTQKTTNRKWALFACSVPIAMIGNMVRIMSICVVAAGFGQEVATGYYHDYSGYVVFLVGVLLMIKAGDLIQKYGAVAGRWLPHFRGWRRDRAQPEGRPEGGSATRAFWTVGGLCVVTVGVFVGIRMTPAPTYDPAFFLASALPDRIGDFSGDVPWFCRNPQCMNISEENELVKAGFRKEGGYVCPLCGEKLFPISLAETTELPIDTTFYKRNYHSADGLTCAVNVVIAGRSRGSIHRPELCLPAQGFAMLSAGRMSLRLGRGRPLIVRKIDAKRTDSPSVCLVYWFLSREHETCSHSQRILLDVWDRSIHNRVNRWAMVAINVSSPLDSPEAVARFEAFLSELYSRLILNR